MRCRLFLLACGLAMLPARADEAASTAAIPAPDSAPAPAATTPSTDASPTMTPDLPDASTPPNTDSPDAAAFRIPYAHTTEGNGEVRDSIGSAVLRPMPDVKEKEPTFLTHVDYLRKHHDNIMAISYLRDIITQGDILPQERAQAMLELADTLATVHQEAESLCWLKLWMELYPGRPEAGAVAYRIGTLYSQMGLADMARDAYYLALAHTVNEADVKNPEDLQRYTRLTVGTLWGMAANEYQNGQWKRAAELFQRFQNEAPSASPLAKEKAAYLQADCYYQLKQVDAATKQYEETLAAHPFNPLAPEARLRLYHLDIIAKQPAKAEAELESLAWTVRTVFPKDETYWQEQAAQLLLSLNQKNQDVLPPLVQASAKLPPQGKTWQDALNHYDALVSYQAGLTQANMDSQATSSTKTAARRGLPEDQELVAMDRYLNQLLPPSDADSTP